MPRDTYRALTARSLVDEQDGSESPIAPSSRPSTPGCYSSEHDYPSCTSTNPPSNRHLSSQSTTPISEISEYFTRHSIQPQRHSTPNPLDHAHAPLGLYRAHDPTDLALLSTTYAHRIARRRQSLRGLQCNPKHLHRVASLMEGMVEDWEDTTCREITSQPSSISLSGGSSSVDLSSLTSMRSPGTDDEPNGASLSSSSSYSYLNFDGTSAEVESTPRPKSMSSCRVGKESRHIESHEKVQKPIRMRRRPRRESLVGGR